MVPCEPPPLTSPHTSLLLRPLAQRIPRAPNTIGACLILLLLNSASSPQQQAAIDGRLEAHRSILFPISQFPVSQGSPFGSNKTHGSVSLSSLSTLHFALLHARHITLYRSTVQLHTLSTTSLVHPTGNFRMPLCTLVSPGCYHGEQLQVPPALPPPRHTSSGPRPRVPPGSA